MMQIAPGVDAAVWEGLKLDDPNSGNWVNAVDILAARIHDRYIEPVDFLIASEANKPPSERRFGFTLLAIDCLVVETLGAFIEGLEDTDGKSKSLRRHSATFSEHEDSSLRSSQVMNFQRNSTSNFAAGFCTKLKAEGQAGSGRSGLCST
jgi:hypothetical protein